jgi:two-component system, NarL family, nitrate/nitrite response regulator NarL
MAQPVSSRSRTRVLIIEDHALFAESLELALSMERYAVRRIIVGPEATTASVLRAAARYEPGIVLLDLDLGVVGDATPMITALARLGAQVVVVTASGERARWGDCLRSGARLVLPKTRPLNDILAVVRRISQGRAVIDLEEREELLRVAHKERAKQQQTRARLGQLTTREREILAHLMAGRPVRDIARISVVSEATVRTQVKSILSKLEVSSQLAAVGLAHEVGWSRSA